MHPIKLTTTTIQRDHIPPSQILMVGIWNGFMTVTDKETAWRVSFIVPAVVVLLVALGQLFLADDCPRGNYKELEAHGAMTRKSSGQSFEKVKHLRILPDGECTG